MMVVWGNALVVVYGAMGERVLLALAGLVGATGASWSSALGGHFGVGLGWFWG